MIFRPKWKISTYFEKKIGRFFFSYSLDNKESNRKVPSFYFVSGKTRCNHGFCALFCYQNSPFYEKVELPEPFTDWGDIRVRLLLIESFPTSRVPPQLHGRKRTMNQLFCDNDINASVNSSLAQPPRNLSFFSYGWQIRGWGHLSCQMPARRWERK